MAKQNVQKLREVRIDNTLTQVPETAKIIDIVAPEVTAVEAYNKTSGKVEYIPRARFNQGLPEGITTYLTSVEKGAA